MIETARKAHRVFYWGKDEIPRGVSKNEKRAKGRTARFLRRKKQHGEELP